METKPKRTTKVVKKPVEKAADVKNLGGPKEEIKPVVPSPVADAINDLDDKDDFVITEKDIASAPERYFEAVGRRKTALARVRLFTRGDKEFLINGKPYQEYFTMENDRENATASLKKMKCLDKFRVMAVVRGGGHSAQSEAVRHGTARALVLFNGNFKKRLRKVNYLTRDPRMRERKKFGLKRARKAPQWAKR